MDKRERVARAICAEKCAFMGEPPCYTIEGEWPNPNCSEPGCHAEAQAAIAALEPMDKPRVKPLVWDRWDGGMTVAKTTIGTYNLAQNFRLCFLNGSYRNYETEEAAKAAAQADYEARILAALEPVTVQEAARVLLDAMPYITAKPLVEMSDAMKIEAHPAILLRGLCAALRDIARKDAE